MPHAVRSDNLYTVTSLSFLLYQLNSITSNYILFMNNIKTGKPQSTQAIGLYLVTLAYKQ